MSNEGAPLCEIRLIVLDVDGTVLTPEHQVAPATRTAIDGVRANGVRVTLASSRSPLGLRPVLRELGLDDRWFVAYQGALAARWNADDELDVLAESRIDQHGARPRRKVCERDAARRRALYRHPPESGSPQARATSTNCINSPGLFPTR